MALEDELLGTRPLEPETEAARLEAVGAPQAPAFVSECAELSRRDGPALADHYLARLKDELGSSIQTLDEAHSPKLALALCMDPFPRPGELM